jgi:hypothetical protein
VPVVLDGVGVLPGSYVFADSSGAVVIPDRQVEEVLAEARKVEAADAPFATRLLVSGASTPKGNVGGEMPRSLLAPALRENQKRPPCGLLVRTEHVSEATAAIPVDFSTSPNTQIAEPIS